MSAKLEDFVLCVVFHAVAHDRDSDSDAHTVAVVFGNCHVSMLSMTQLNASRLV